MRRLPVGEDQRLARREIERELPSLGAEPETIFAAVVVELAARLSLFDELAVDVAKALAFGFDGARHHARLVLGGHHDAPAVW